MPRLITFSTSVMVTTALAQLSDAVGGVGKTKSAAQVKVASKAPCAISQVGAMSSFTVMVIVQVVSTTLPQSSDAVYTISLTNLLLHSCIMISSLITVTITSLSPQLSVAVGGTGSVTSSEQVKFKSNAPGG